jgi:hypothetical protein
MMRSLTFLLAISLSITFCFETYAQQHIAGTVVDSASRVALPGAGVSVFRKDSLVLSGVAGEGGKFNFQNIAPGDYILQANFIGYKIERIPVNIRKEGEPLRLLVRLPADMNQLDAVQIEIAPPAVVLKGDTTEFNASSFTTEPYADSDALIGQLPGVEIDEEGKLKVQGEEVQRIMVDGKEFFSSDPRIAMKTLPADIIAKIQVIDEKSDQAKFTGFDDGERAKVLNIVTKPDRRRGFFGKAAGGYGNMDRYNTGGSFNAFEEDRRFSFNVVSNNVNQQDFSMENLAGGDTNTGNRRGRGGTDGSGLRSTNNIAANFNNEWNKQLKLNGNYSFNSTNSTVVSLLNREYLVGNRSNQLSIQNQESYGRNKNHRANFRVEYDPDTLTSVSFRPNLGYQKSSFDQFSNNRTSLETSEPVNASVRNNENDRQNFNISGNFSIRRRLNDRGRTLSLNVDGNVNSNKGLAYNLSMNEFYEDYLLDRIDTVNNQNHTRSDGNGVSGRLAYTEPLGGKSRLQANYSLRNTNDYSNRETFEYLAETGQFDELNERLSNEFRNEYIYHSAGAGYLFSTEKLRFDAGLNFQHASLQNQRSFPNQSETARDFQSYLPNAGLTYRFSKQKDLEFNYNTATNAPNINQLQDVVNNQNSLNVREGNPDLKQEYGHRFALRYKTVNPASGFNFAANLHADFSNDRIVNSTFLADQDTLLGSGVLLGKGGRFTRPENVDGYYNMRANGSIGIPLKKLKLNVNMNGGVFYRQEVGLLNDERTYSNSTGINQRLSVHSRISEKLIFSFSYSGNYNVVTNNLNPELSYNFYNQNLRNDFTVLFWKGMKVSSTLSYYYNTGLTSDDSQKFVLWNASLAKKFFKRQEGELALSAYDLLNSNTNVSRNISDQFIEDRQSNILNQYFILSFTYHLRKFGSNRRTAG